ITRSPDSSSFFLVETAGYEVLDCRERSGLVLSADGKRDMRPLGGREQQDPEDALAVHFLAVLADLDRRFEPARRLHEFRRRPGVKPEPVADRHFSLDHRPAGSGAGGAGASSLASRSEATQIDRCPRSRASRAISATGLPLSWSVAHFSTIGRVTPGTNSTPALLRKRSVRVRRGPP